MLPLIQGVIARRMLLNFRADADVVQRLLPAPLQCDRQHGHAIVGVCLIRLENLRPLDRFAFAYHACRRRPMLHVIVRRNRVSAQKGHSKLDQPWPVSLHLVRN